jgi:hypothetical protein
MVRLTVFLFAAAAALAQPPRPGLFPRSLAESLALSDAQAGAINQLNVAYDRFWAEKQARIAEVRADIDAKTADDPLDPVALGVRYAEIEAINRDLRDKSNALRADVAKVLTPAQQPRLQALADAQALQPLITQAECSYFLTPFPQRIIPAFRVDPISIGVISGPIISGAFGFSSSFCQSGFRAAPAPRPVSDFEAYLGLDRTQVAAIDSLAAAYFRFNDEKQLRVEQVQSDINQLTAADPLDPGALGLRYAEIEAINRDLRDKQSELRAGIAKVLTAAQQAKVKVLDAARSQASLIDLAVCENLLVPVPSSASRLGLTLPTPALPARFCGN